MSAYYSEHPAFVPYEATILIYWGSGTEQGNCIRAEAPPVWDSKNLEFPV